MVTAQATLKLWVTRSLQDKEGMKDAGKRNCRMTVKLNIYSLTYTE
jgi:hypothetical protein